MGKCRSGCFVVNRSPTGPAGPTGPQGDTGATGPPPDDVTLSDEGFIGQTLILDGAGPDLVIRRIQSGDGINLSAGPETLEISSDLDVESGTWDPEYNPLVPAGEPPEGFVRNGTIDFTEAYYTRIGNIVYAVAFGEFESGVVIGALSANDRFTMQLTQASLPFPISGGNPTGFSNANFDTEIEPLVSERVTVSGGVIPNVNFLFTSFVDIAAPNVQDGSRAYFQITYPTS